MICTDKTGTLTEAALRVVDVVPAPAVDRERLERRWAATPRAARAQQHPGRDRRRVTRPSRHGGRAGAVLLTAALERVGARRARRSCSARPSWFELGPLAAEAQRASDAGRRVLAVGRADGRRLGGAAGPTRRRRGPRCWASSCSAERLRRRRARWSPTCASRASSSRCSPATHPDTVAAIARDAGIPLDGRADHRRRAARRPGSSCARPRLRTVVGRVSPEDKRRFVQALADAGRYVAMVGDGVNDVPALKASRLAIAQGTGAQMARSVADLVLVRRQLRGRPADGRAGPPGAAQPPARRQALRHEVGIRRVPDPGHRHDLDGLSAAAPPLQPRRRAHHRHPDVLPRARAQPGAWRTARFGRDAARFAVPAGALVGVGVLASYLFALDASGCRSSRRAPSPPPCSSRSAST